MEVIYKKTVVDELKKVLLNADVKDQVIDKIIISNTELRKLVENVYRTSGTYGVKNIEYRSGDTFTKDGKALEISGTLTFYFSSLHGATKKAVLNFEVEQEK